MPALRELYAIFGVQYDPTGAKKADADLNTLGKKAKGAGAGIASVNNPLAALVKNLGLLYLAKQTAGAVFGTIERASDAEETLNVLNAAFGEGTDEVIAFADETAKAMGRSTYQIQDFAGRIGALVSPAFKSMGKEGQLATATISKDFAGLAVDLSSFFNTTEEEAITALRSGISGESEPLKKFGVDLTEAGIADSLGISPKKLRAMNRADKMIARHQAIMIQTANAQGDAERTADGFANASRAVLAGLYDLSVTIGQKLLPGVKSLTVGLRDFVQKAALFVRNTKLVEAVLIVAAAAATLFGLRALWAGRQAILAWARILIPLALVLLMVEDILVTMAGGESVFNDLMEWITGIDGAGKLWTDAMEAMGAALYDWLHGISGAGSAIDSFKQIIKDGYEDIWNWLVTGWGEVWDSIVASVRTHAMDIAKVLLSVIPGGTAVLGGIEAVSSAAQSAPGFLDKAKSFLGFGSGSVPAQGTNSSTTTATTVNVNVNGSTNPRETGKEVERATRQALRDERRKVTQGV